MVVACIRRVVDGTLQEVVRTFRPETEQLLGLGDWLAWEEVTHVAMEPGGPHWKAVWTLFAGAFELLLANAQYFKQVPGRKPAVEDSQWIAELLQYGLLRPGPVPQPPGPPLSDWLQERARLVRRKVQTANRIQTMLADAGIGWAGAACDLLQVAGRGRVRVIVRGGKGDGLPPPGAPPGGIGGHPHFLLGLLLDELEFLEKQVGRLSQRIAELLSDPASEAMLLPTMLEPRPTQGLPAAVPVPMPVPVEDGVASQPRLPGVDAGAPGATADPGPPPEARSGGREGVRSEKRRRRRVRVVTDDGRYRQHRRKKLLRILWRLVVWPLALVIGIALFWLVLDRLTRPPPQ
jgi:hypothetical protein